MVPIYPVTIDLGNECAKDIPKRSGRHAKKAPGRPPTRKF